MGKLLGKQKQGAGEIKRGKAHEVEEMNGPVLQRYQLVVTLKSVCNFCLLLLLK